MDKITESLMKEFSEERGLAGLKEYKRFEHFAAHVVVGSEYSESFDSHDIVVGDDDQVPQQGGTDTGLDGISVIVNGVLVRDLDEFNEVNSLSPYLDVVFLFIQAETSSSFEGTKAGDFGFGVRDFFSESPKLPRSEKVSDAATIWTAVYGNSGKFKRNPVCKLFYVTTGQWTDDEKIGARLDDQKEQLLELGLFSEVEFNPWGASRLQDEYRRNRNSVTAEFTFRNKVTVPDVPGVTQAYIGLLPWREFKKLIMDGNGVLHRQLFFDNLRDWLGTSSPVNEEISTTVSSVERGRFALMNNGVTIIAGDVRATGDKFKIDDYQIVNGCQTSNVLFQQRDVLDLGDAVHVPIRLIATDDEDVKKSIIKATNRQTAIQEHLFFALETFPKRLELFFDSFTSPAERLYFERRPKQYEAKAIEKTRVITFDNMIRSFAAMFLNTPHQTTRNFRALKEKLGKGIFAENHRLEPYHAAAMGYWWVDFMLRNRGLNRKYKVTRFHILTAMRILSGGWDMPEIHANKMKQYCEAVSSGFGEDLVERAVGVIDRVAPVVEGSNLFNRDDVRTDSFTESVIKEARAQVEPAS